MLSTISLEEMALSLGIIALICAAASVWLAIRSGRWALGAYRLAEKNTGTRVSRKDIAEFTAELTDLRDAYDALLKSHKKLRSRIGMRENRAKGQIDEPEPLNAQSDKRKLRNACRERGLLR